MLKSKTQIVVQKTKIELQKIVRYDQKLRFRTKYQVLSELFDVSWNTWFSDRKSQFSLEIKDIYIVNPNFLFGKSGI